MKKILVTGGAGFVGSHLCERLLEEGNFVVCLDNLQTGSINNLVSYRSSPNFLFIEEDITNPLLKLLEYDFDEIYNLACPASPIHYQIDPIKTTLTSVLGAKNVLDLAYHGNSKILQASTSEVYGDPLVHPQSEEYFGNVNPCGVRSCYDEGKRCAESLFFDYHRMYEVRSKVVRIFNTYGERMATNDGRVISNFIVQALGGENITIYGDGKQTRSFQYISDLVEGLIRVMSSDNDSFSVINLGNPEEYTMIELAEKIKTLTNSKSKIEFRLLPQDDPKRRKPDITLAKEVLDWSPKVELEEGLRNTIEYFEKIGRLDK